MRLDHQLQEHHPKSRISKYNQQHFEILLCSNKSKTILSSFSLDKFSKGPNTINIMNLTTKWKFAIQENSYYRFDHSEKGLLFKITIPDLNWNFYLIIVYLLVQPVPDVLPSPLYPALHVQVKLPAVSAQVAWASQSSVPSVHSSISTISTKNFNTSHSGKVQLLP